MKTGRASAIVAGFGASVAVVLALGADLPTSWTVQATGAAYSVETEPTSPNQGTVPAGGSQKVTRPAAAEAAKPAAAPSAAPPAAPQSAPPVVVTNGDRAVAKVALTFDADLSNYTLNRILNGTMPDQYNVAVVDYLERTGTPATMFVTGLWAERYPLAMQRFAANESFEIANHTYSHEAWTSSCYKLPYVTDVAAKRSQVATTNEVIMAYTDQPPRYFRFPGLCHNPDDVALVTQMGLVPVDTDIEGSDAFAKDPYAVAQSIAAQVQPGSVILLHLNGAPNASATLQIVQQLLPLLNERGLQPVTLEELLGQ